MKNVVTGRGSVEQEAVETEDLCRRCSYPLTGLDDRTACPECGLLVGLSRTQSNELRHAKLGWLGRLISIGPLLIIAYIAWPIAIFYGAWVAENGPSWVGSPYVDQAINTAVPISGLVLGLLVYVLLRRVERSGPAEERSGRRTIWTSGLLWLGVLVCLALVGGTVWLELKVDELLRNPPTASPDFQGDFMAFVELQNAYYDRVADWQDLQLFAQGGIFLLVLFMTGCLIAIIGRRLGQLSKRAMAPLLATDSRWAWLAVAMVPWAVLTLLAYSMLDDYFEFESRGWLDINRPVVFGGYIALFCALIIGYCYGLYLLVRFSIAIAMVRRQAKQLLAEFDAAVNPALLSPEMPA